MTLKAASSCASVDKKGRNLATTRTGQTSSCPVLASKWASESALELAATGCRALFWAIARSNTSLIDVASSLFGLFLVVKIGQDIRLKAAERLWSTASRAFLDAFGTRKGRPFRVSPCILRVQKGLRSSIACSPQVTRRSQQLRAWRPDRRALGYESTKSVAN